MSTFTKMEVFLSVFLQKRSSVTGALLYCLGIQYCMTDSLLRFQIFQRYSFILAQYRNHLKKLQNQLQVKEDELNGLRQKMRDMSQNSRTQFVTGKGTGIVLASKLHMHCFVSPHLLTKNCYSQPAI